MAEFSFMESELVPRLWRAYADNVARGLYPNRCHVYVHSPYCAQKCRYCLYESTKLPSAAHLDAALHRLMRETGMIAPLLCDIKMTGLYFGGGTPTLYPLEHFDALLSGVFKAFQFIGDPVNTCEMHPASATDEKIRIAAAHGINRISFGVQSLTPRVLQCVNRLPVTPERLEHLVRTAKDAGVREVNVDLIVPLPEETVQSFQQSAARAAACLADTMVLYIYNDAKASVESMGSVDPMLAQWEQAQALFLDVVRDHGYTAVQNAGKLLNSIVYTRHENVFSARHRYEFYTHNAQSVLGLGTDAKSNVYAHAIYKNFGPEKRLALYGDRYYGVPKDLRYEAALILTHHMKYRLPLSRAAFKDIFYKDPLEFFPGEIDALVKKRFVTVHDAELCFRMKFKSEKQFIEFQQVFFGVVP